ncbi:monomeric [FeFe] hydrogenase [Desulfobotulus sp.]|uniref:monomeric [FeFe] hydrogenase n=1 Tax=Desulfobotulus sp. TaxID=1940337 RepID=UPI002A366CEB|nr:monomeric [FeFe] hydrogenase [Desulfobotulus sp.]MDY0163831.1 monomeric [FeFe] hydrogenase [Desulfobotulus sp.]
MLNINNKANQIKREILIRIAEYQLAGKLTEAIHSLPKKMLPLHAEPFRCCVHHDREILRLRIIARLGHSIENYDEEKELSAYAAEALTREKPTEPMLTVLDDACNACIRACYMVTNACQACIARPCMTNCPKKCIHIRNGRALIDDAGCINCGLCEKNCPFHAIIKIPVPCEEACPVNAISKNAQGKERIDYSKCIFCGACVRDCPFGAMVDKGQLVDVVRHIMEGKRVVALYAPAIAAQFRAAPGQLEAAFRRAGFHKSLEVALGADITAKKEALEFEERMAHGDTLMTTSCCPAYVRAIEIYVPELLPFISETRSPMHYSAALAREEDAEAILVFIGPCLAKRKEGFDDPYVDYVLSAEEIGAFFVAKEIDVSAMEALCPEIQPSGDGRNFAQSGGVANAVKNRLAHPETLKVRVINGLDKAGMKALKAYGRAASGKTPTDANLVEVMACAGGCINGPLVLTHPKIAGGQLKKYVESGSASESL